MADTLKELGALEYNAKLARRMRRLKKEAGATTVRQEYRGTGSQAHRRQMWVRMPGLPRGFTDVWLDDAAASLGGVSDLRRLPALSYGDRTVDEMYEVLREALLAAAAEGAA